MRETLATLGRQRLIAAGAGVVAIVALVLVAAVHDGGASAGPRSATRLPLTGGATPLATASPTTTSPAATSAPAAPAGTPRAAATQAPAAAAASADWFTVTLGSTCVVPGGTQTLSAQSRPGYTVSYNSHYADGSMGNTNGGFGVLATDAAGRASTSWTVATTAPLGSVTVYLGTANGGAPTTLRRSFVVASHC